MFAPKTKSNRKDRDGITIVEVLTSIVVAMIGVFGVMVMIPFAVQQAQSGLDLDDSTNMADDAIATFQIYEFHRINDDGFLPWVDANNTVNNIAPYAIDVGDEPHLVQPGANPIVDPADVNNQPYGHMVNRGPYWLDPLGIYAGYTALNIFEQDFTDPELNEAVLPFRYLTLIDKAQDTDGDDVTDFIDRDVNNDEVLDAEEVDATTGDPDPFLFDADAIPRSFARRLFQTEDDLQFSLESDQNSFPIADGLPPQQIFDVQGTTPIRRQSRGELSWSMVLVPENAGLPFDVANEEFNAVTQFRSYMLIYKNRRLIEPVLETNPLFNAQFDPRLKRAKVFYDVNNPANLADTPNPLFRGGNIVVEDDGRAIQIPKNDWIMLANRDLNAEPGFQHQVGFYRVIGTDPVNRTLTLDGPEFEFGMLEEDSGLPTHTPTYIVYLQDVVNVYQRTIRWEGASSWNQ